MVTKEEKGAGRINEEYGLTDIQYATIYKTDKHKDLLYRTGKYVHYLSLFFFFFYFLVLHLRHMEVPRQGQIGATATGLHHSHSNAGSEPCL